MRIQKINEINWLVMADIPGLEPIELQCFPKKRQAKEWIANTLLDCVKEMVSA